MHGYNWGIDDLYFACLLRPLNTDIQANSSEIAAAKWVDVSICVGARSQKVRSSIEDLTIGLLLAAFQASFTYCMP
jgi:hypothetical protein